MIKYTVKKGDTLGEIADAYGVTVSAICAANPERIKNPNIIGVGWQIAIPAASPAPDPAPSSDAETAIAKALAACVDALCALPEFSKLEVYLRGRDH